MDRRIIFSIGVAAILVFGLFVFSNNNKVDQMDMNKVASSAIAYIDNNFIQGATPINLISVSEESGLYKIVIEIDGTNHNTYASKDGRLFFPEGMIINEQEVQNEAPATEAPVTTENQTIGGFQKVSETPCLENGKPILYYFGSSSCPFCEWQTPVMERVAEIFGNTIVPKFRIDTEEDREIFSNYSQGGVPLIVVGCQYSRVGAGTQWREEADINYISALSCKLTNNQPVDVCAPLKDLINKI